MVGLVVIVGMAVVGQFWQFDLYLPHGFLILFVSGGVVILSYFSSLVFSGYETTAYLPWWLLLTSWCILTAIVWFLTRRRKEPQGFPVEPTAKTK